MTPPLIKHIQILVLYLSWLLPNGLLRKYQGKSSQKIEAGTTHQLANSRLLTIVMMDPQKGV